MNRFDALKGFDAFAPDIWTYLKSVDKPILMYGTGNGADKILDVFLKYGIPVAEIFTSDDFYREKEFRGYRLKSYSQISDEYTDGVVVLAFAVFRDDMLSCIREISKKYEVLAPEVPVFGTDYFSSQTLSEYEDEIKNVYSFLSDEKSKQVFADILNYRLTGKMMPLFAAETPREEVFENIIHLTESETYLDLGAYRGDTIEEFLTQTGGKYNAVIALEPDLKNYKKLCEYTDALEEKDKILLFNMASWSSKRVTAFDGGGGRNSSIGDGKYTVHTTDIDSLLEALPEEKHIPTYVKMDVEGAEHETILGMKNLLANHKPKLIVSAYHRTGDIFTLPALIKSINPDYRIYLRHHPYIPDWETNYYCI